MTVGRLLSEVSSQELTEWQAYIRIDADQRKAAQQRAREDREILGGLE